MDRTLLSTMLPMWRLSDDNLATLNHPHFSVAIDVAQPWRGLLASQPSEVKFPSHAAFLRLGVRELVAAENPVTDCYLRGNDVVATYAPSTGRNVQTQIYWRACIHPDDPSAGVEIILSAQTHLLDSRPALVTETSLGSAASLCLADDAWETLAADGVEQRFDADRPARAFLIRPRDAAFSYLEAVFPSDFTGAAWRGTASSVQFSQELFPERLEKGVIRRARLLGLFLPRRDDLELAMQAYSRFIAAPPPLTT